MIEMTIEHHKLWTVGSSLNQHGLATGLLPRMLEGASCSPRVPHMIHMIHIYIYPLVNMQKAIENLAIEIVSFPMKHGWNFHSYVNVYQRVVWIYDG